MTQALDAAGLALGSASISGMSGSQLQTLAQQYFTANYVEDQSYGIPARISVAVGNGTASLSTSVNMPTVLVRLGDLIGCTKCDTMNVPVTSQIVWSTTKLWVSLVLDNTGSMTEADGNGVTKISALKTGTLQLLQILQNAALNPGDIRAAILPFSKDVNAGKSNVNASWIDWTDWQSAPSGSTPSSLVGPGSTCPYTWSGSGYACAPSSTNDPNCVNSRGNDCVANVPSNGLICPSQHAVNANTGQGGHFYNGCYNSVKQVPSCTSSCRYNHTWVPNAHSTWTGCLMDRTQDYDVQDTNPSGANTSFPAENAVSCPPTAFMGLSYDWSSLNNEVNAMQAQGSTNQTVGLDWGWMALTQGTPFNPPPLPQDTQRYIILLSDGLNTQDRWYGDGSNHSTSVDSRMDEVCDNAKADGITIYTIFVDLNGTQGNSSTLQNCASDSSKYFDLTSSGQIITTLNQIAEDLVQLRVAR